MNLKYRIRLQNERVIGPFSIEEIGELFDKGHITGTELCQHFPIGEWKPLSTFDELKEELQEKQKYLFEYTVEGVITDMMTRQNYYEKYSF